MAYAGVWCSASLPNMLQILEMYVGITAPRGPFPGFCSPVWPRDPSWLLPLALKLCLLLVSLDSGGHQGPPPPPPPAHLAFSWGDFETLLHRCQRAPGAGSMSVLLHACPLLPWQIKKKKKKRRRRLLQ